VHAYPGSEEKNKNVVDFLYYRANIYIYIVLNVWCVWCKSRHIQCFSERFLFPKGFSSETVLITSDARVLF